MTNDNKLIILGGIVSSQAKQASCFKIVGREVTLRIVKELIANTLKTHGYSVEIQKLYND